MATDLANAKNAYLRAQINPHFMLRTLNYIHDNTRISEPEAAQAVICLSKLLRYALATERGPEMIPLSKEIEQVEILLNLTRIRKTETFIRFDYDGIDQEAMIIPFVLLSLVENMIKHGNLSRAEDTGRIKLTMKARTLYIETSNPINTGINDTGFHTGLASIEERMFHSYENRAKFYYGKENGHFITKTNVPI